MRGNPIPETVPDESFIGTSKKMAYGKYIRATPGMETFASKKVESLQPLVVKNQACWNEYLCKLL